MSLKGLLSLKVFYSHEMLLPTTFAEIYIQTVLRPLNAHLAA